MPNKACLNLHILAAQLSAWSNWDLCQSFRENVDMEESHLNTQNPEQEDSLMDYSGPENETLQGDNEASEMRVFATIGMVDLEMLGPDIKRLLIVKIADLVMYYGGR
jgi:hypothetical protein